MNTREARQRIKRARELACFHNEQVHPRDLKFALDAVLDVLEAIVSDAEDQDGLDDLFENMTPEGD